MFFFFFSSFVWTSCVWNKELIDWYTSHNDAERVWAAVPHTTVYLLSVAEDGREETHRHRQRLALKQTKRLVIGVLQHLYAPLQGHLEKHHPNGTNDAEKWAIVRCENHLGRLQCCESDMLGIKVAIFVAHIIYGL